MGAGGTTVKRSKGKITLKPNLIVKPKSFDQEIEVMEDVKPTTIEPLVEGKEVIKPIETPTGEVETIEATQAGALEAQVPAKGSLKKTAQTIEEQINKLNEDEFFIKKPIPNYVEIKDINELLTAKANSPNPIVKPLLIQGVTGQAKTASIYSFAQKSGIPLVTLQCRPDMRDIDLIGGNLIFSDGQGGTTTVFKEGTLPHAIDLANKYGTAILLLDEVNVLEPQYQKAMNSLLDQSRRAIYAGNKTWKLKDNAKLIIVGTMNPKSYYGTSPLAPDFKRRFGKILIEYPSAPTERKVLSKVSSNEKLIEQLVELAKFTREPNNVGAEANAALSTATLGDTLEEYESLKAGGFDEKRALQIAIKEFILDNYEDPIIRNAVANRVKDLDIYEGGKKAKRKGSGEVEDFEPEGNIQIP